MTYFRKLFSGQLPPLDTFLIGFVGVAIALNLSALWLAWPVTLLSLNYGAFAARTVQALWLIGCILFSLIALGAFRRSAAQMMLWLRFGGLLLILLTTVQYSYRLFAVFHPGLPMSRFAVKREVEAMRLILPQQIGEGVTLSGVRLNGEIFEMTVDMEGPGLIARRTNMAETELGAEACRSYRGMLRGRTVSRIENIYRTQDGEFITYLDERDCPNL